MSTNIRVFCETTKFLGEFLLLALILYPADTRTLAQKVTMEELLHSLCLDDPNAEILGHRDLPNVRKDCPCFDVRDWLEDIDFHI